MAFIIDRQTFDDLQIFNEKGKKSIFNFFDRAITHRGKEELREMFNYPLSDINEITERQELISYMNRERLSFNVDKYVLNYIEYYLLLSNKPVKVSRFNAWHKALTYKLRPTNEYYLRLRGIKYVIEFLQELFSFVTGEEGQNVPHLLRKQMTFIVDTIQNTQLRQIIGFRVKKKIGAMNIERFDHIFRYCEYDRLNDILRIVYKWDAFQAVADTTAELGLVFPKIMENKEIEITGLYHPFLRNAVANDVRLDEEGNVFFLTGANMAGKSTFLKAFGIAVYLAHLGFPVAAASMRTGVFNGIFSTINIADNLDKGYSHFYNEVLRVKSVAQEINRTGNLVVIFDELFRGTNVKDAFDASLAIVSAFAKVKGSMFLVSTHIMEIAEQLRKFENIHFRYFHTVIEGKTPVYSYRLHDGVTEERLGMLIIGNERIIETIRGSSTV